MPKDTFHNLPQDKRDKIVDVAIDEFIQRGFHNASITTICTRAEIAKGSFYQYFEDKKDLFLYLLEMIGRKKLEFIGSRGKFDWADFFTTFRDMMLTGAQFGLAYPRYSDFAARLMDSDLQDESFIRMKQLSADYFRGIVAKAREKGQLRSDIPLDLAVMFLNSLSVDFGKHVMNVAEVSFNNFHKPESQARLQSVDLVGMTDDLIKMLRSGLGAHVQDQKTPGKEEDHD